MIRRVQSLFVYHISMRPKLSDFPKLRTVADGAEAQPSKGAGTEELAYVGKLEVIAASPIKRQVNPLVLPGIILAISLALRPFNSEAASSVLMLFIPIYSIFNWPYGDQKCTFRFCTVSGAVTESERTMASTAIPRNGYPQRDTFIEGPLCEVRTALNKVLAQSLFVPIRPGSLGMHPEVGDCFEVYMTDLSEPDFEEQLVLGCTLGRYQSMREVQRYL